LGFTIVLATGSDLELLVRHRQSMWGEIHPDMGLEISEVEEKTRNWIREKLASGALVGFISKTGDGEVAGSGCLWVREEQPRPGATGSEFPYLMSMYTEKQFRGKGVAKSIVEAAIEWSKTNGFDRVVLHASESGRPVYEKAGFKPTSEMRLKLSSGDTTQRISGKESAR
jgi:GNAT superfamily N-acetyltransferase